MDRDQIVKFTSEGFQEVAAALNFLPEEQRIAILTATILGLSQ